MKIDPHSTPMPAVQAARTKQAPSQGSDAFQVPTGSVVETLENPQANTDRFKEVISKVRAMPDVRAEVVQSRKATDPVKAPTDDQLMSFIHALKNEEIS